MKDLMKFVPLVLMVAIFAVSGYFLISGKNPKLVENQMVGKPAPIQTLQGLQPRDEAYLVNFFASWCPACRSEHEVLMAAGEFAVVGIAYKDSQEPLDKYLDKKGDPYDAIILDDDGMIGIEWGITGTPESFLIGTDGIVIEHFSGPMQMDDMRRIVKND